MTKRAMAPIVNGPVALRLLEAGDLPMTRRWRNQDEIRKWFLTSTVVTAEQHAAWFEQYRDRDDDFVFVIEDTARRRQPVGQVSIYQIDWDHRLAKFGRLMIGELAAQRRGLARAAVATLVNVTESTLGLEELRLEVLSGNHVAIAIYQQCGFGTVEQVGDEVRMVRHSKPMSRPS